MPGMIAAELSGGSPVYVLMSVRYSSSPCAFLCGPTDQIWVQDKVERQLRRPARKEGERDERDAPLPTCPWTT